MVVPQRHPLVLAKELDRLDKFTESVVPRAAARAAVLRVRANADADERQRKGLDAKAHGSDD